MKSQNSELYHYGFWGIILLAAILRFWAISFGLPGHFRPDEEYIVGPVLSFQSGRLNPGLFNYPALFMYAIGAVVALLRLLSSFTHFDLMSYLTEGDLFRTYLLCRGVSACFGVLLVGLTLRIARGLHGESIALLLGSIVALCPLLVRDSHFATTDQALACITLLTVHYLAMMKYSWRGYLIGGTLVGIACGIKYPAAALGLPFVIAHLWGGWRWSHQPKLIAAGILSILVFLLTNPYAILDFDGFIRDLKTVQHFAKDGLAGVAELHGASWLLNFSLLSLNGGIVLLIFLGLFRFLARDRRELFGWLLLSFTLALLTIYYRANWVPIRYFIPLISPMALLGGFALRWIQMHQSTWLRRSIFGMVAVFAILPLGSRSIALLNVLAQSDTRLLAWSWVSDYLPVDSRIAMQDFPYGKPPPSPNVQYTLVQGAIPGEFKYAVTDSSPIFFYSRGMGGAFGRSIEERGKVLAEFTPGRSTPVPSVYDLSDAFFLPVDDFNNLERPGPTVTLFTLQGSE